MKQTKTIMNFSVFIIGFILVYCVHMLIGHTDILDYSSFSAFLADSDVAWSWFIESVYIFIFGLICTSSCHYMSKAVASKHVIVDEVHVTDNIMTSKQLVRSILFEVISAFILCLIAYSSYRVYFEITTGTFPDELSFSNIFPCISTPLLIIGICSIIFFSFYKEVPEPDETRVTDFGITEDEARNFSFKMITRSIAVTTILLALVDYCIHGYNMYTLINDNLLSKLTPFAISSLIIRTVFCISGIIILMAGLSGIIMTNLSGTGKVVVEIFCLILKILIIGIGVIMCLKLLDIDTATITTALSAVGLGSSFCFKKDIQNLSSSLSIISKLNIKKGDYLTDRFNGFVQDFDCTGLWVVLKDQRTYVTYTTAKTYSKHSYPETCGTITFTVNIIHRIKNIQNIINAAFPEIYASGSSLLKAMPIYLVSSAGSHALRTYTFLIPTTADCVDKAEKYALEQIIKVLEENGIRVVDSSTSLSSDEPSNSSAFSDLAISSAPAASVTPSAPPQE